MPFSRSGSLLLPLQTLVSRLSEVLNLTGILQGYCTGRTLPALLREGENISTEYPFHQGFTIPDLGVEKSEPTPCRDESFLLPCSLGVSNIILPIH